mmetsp:Transcript_11788/g.30288  ORF Transcript_11788/g.30288 Transcript_11788/m.30288 type:complete len:241 (-) Transcript_11788:490-1212(-)
MKPKDPPQHSKARPSRSSFHLLPKHRQHTRNVEIVCWLRGGAGTVELRCFCCGSYGVATRHIVLLKRVLSHCLVDRHGRLADRVGSCRHCRKDHRCYLGRKLHGRLKIQTGDLRDPCEGHLPRVQALLLLGKFEKNRHHAGSVKLLFDGHLDQKFVQELLTLVLDVDVLVGIYAEETVEEPREVRYERDARHRLQSHHPRHERLSRSSVQHVHPLGHQVDERLDRDLGVHFRHDVFEQAV